MYLKGKLVCLIWQTAEGKLRFSFNLWCRFNNKNRSQNSDCAVQLQTMLQVTYQSSVSCSSTDTRACQLMTVSETGPSSADNFATFKEQSFWRNRSCWNSQVLQCQVHESRVLGIIVLPSEDYWWCRLAVLYVSVDYTIHEYQTYFRWFHDFKEIQTGI